MTLNEFPKKNCTYEEFIDRYTNLLLEDLKELYPEVKVNSNLALSDVLKQIYDKTREDFVFIIDEWDYILIITCFQKMIEKTFWNFKKFIKR